jgi:hypothetical protein
MGRCPTIDSQTRVRGLDHPLDSGELAGFCCLALEDEFASTSINFAIHTIFNNSSPRFFAARVTLALYHSILEDAELLSLITLGQVDERDAK